MLVLDPATDRIVDANEAAARLLGHPRDALRAMTASALHPGQVPALIVFTQGVQAKGRWWTHTLTPWHGASRALNVEAVGTVLPDGLVLVTLFDLDARRQRQVGRVADRHMRAGLSEWQRMERIFRDIEFENQLILRVAGEGIYGVNVEGVTTIVNPAAEQVFQELEPGGRRPADPCACPVHSDALRRIGVDVGKRRQNGRACGELRFISRTQSHTCSQFCSSRRAIHFKHLPPIAGIGCLQKFSKSKHL